MDLLRFYVITIQLLRLGTEIFQPLVSADDQIHFDTINKIVVAAAEQAGEAATFQGSLQAPPSDGRTNDIGARSCLPDEPERASASAERYPKAVGPITTNGGRTIGDSMPTGLIVRLRPQGLCPPKGHQTRSRRRLNPAPPAP